ncbi:rhomboid-like protein [Streptomyces sp. NPDC032161]|uniref:rhomboid-like protein n=1 Tax=unclassified Streptomyces TaxID=2593676 RepID=UPI0033E89A4E
MPALSRGRNGEGPHAARGTTDGAAHGARSRAGERGAAPLLDGIPRQRRTEEPADRGPARAGVTAPAAMTASSFPGSPASFASAPRRARWVRLLPTPTGTPFTFGYLLVLAATSLFMTYADPHTVDELLSASSTDVAHLGRTPLLVLGASALWVVDGFASPYVLGFAFVLTALERRIGGWRTAGVFLLGHVVATLATEIPVGLSVVAGHLPRSSLHRLDYGISFGLMASVGALAGLLTPWLRALVLGGVGAMLLNDLLRLADPLADWGHPLALLLGVACWPLLRRTGGGGGSPG